MNKHIEERLELSEVIDYAMRDWDDYIDECREEEIQPIDTFEEYIADAVLDAGYRKTEWISVEERLPSKEEYRDEYGELIPILVCEKDTQYPYRAMYDGTEWGDGLMKIRGITHWMPLPEAPMQ